MRPTHDGVLLPDEMLGANDAEKSAYAAEAKAVSRTFCDAYFALEAEVERRFGLDEANRILDRG